MKQAFWNKKYTLSSSMRYLSLVLVCLFMTFLYASTTLQAHMLRASQGSTRSVADEVVYLSNIHVTRLIALGHNHAAADFLWIRSIQYFVSHFMTDRRYPWLEHFVDQIITLDPHFKQAYLWAASCILYGQKITADRVHRSNRLYQKALERFPNDYEAAYRLGMNYYSELRVDDPELKAKYQAMGLAYFERAAQAPNAPKNVSALIRGIAKRMGRQEVLFYTLSDEYIRAKNPEEKRYVKERLDQLIQKMNDSGTLDKMLQEIQHIESKRKAIFPYLNALDFELINEDPSTIIRWQDLID
jgi:hypothetical protein